MASARLGMNIAARNRPLPDEPCAGACLITAGTRVWLDTCSFDHPLALPFYQRSGFVPFRRQIEIAEDPRLDGARCGAARAGD